MENTETKPVGRPKAAQEAPQALTAFEHLQEAYSLIARDQGVDKPNTRMIAIVITNLYRGEGKNFILSVRQGLRGSVAATRTARTVAEKPRGVRETPQRSPTTTLGNSDNNASKTSRLQRQAQRLGETLEGAPVAAADKPAPAKTTPPAKVEMPTPDESQEKNLSPLNTDEAKVAATSSPKEIARVFGQARIKATLMKMGHIEEDFKDRSGTQLAVMLKKAIND